VLQSKVNPITQILTAATSMIDYFRCCRHMESTGTGFSPLHPFLNLLEWKDDDELKLQWKQLMGSLDDLFVRGCFDSPSEYMGLRSVAEDSFVFPLVDAMYFKYLYQENGFVDLTPNMSVQVIRTRIPANSSPAFNSTRVSRYLVRVEKNGRSLFLQSLDTGSKSSYPSYALEKDQDLSTTFHKDEFLRYF
jgi:hypothetical protein